MTMSMYLEYDEIEDDDGQERLTPKPAVPVDDQDLGRWAADLTAVASKASGRKLVPFDIQPVQYRILMVVHRGQADTVGQMSNLMPVDAASISRHTNKLVDIGLLRRRRLRSDRRTVRLSLSDKGKELVPKMAEQVRQDNELLMQGLTASERRTFFEVIGKILANAETMDE